MPRFKMSVRELDVISFDLQIVDHSLIDEARNADAPIAALPILCRPVDDERSPLFLEEARNGVAGEARHCSDLGHCEDPFIVWQSLPPALSLDVPSTRRVFAIAGFASGYSRT